MFPKVTLTPNDRSIQRTISTNPHSQFAKIATR